MRAQRGELVGFMEYAFLLLIGLAAFSVLFSGMEVAMFSLRNFDVQELREQNPRLGNQLEGFLQKPRRTLSIILLGDVLINVPLGILALFLLRETTIQLPLWLASLLVFGLIIGICDFLPKVLALRNPQRWALFSVRILSKVAPILSPLASLTEGIVERLVSPLVPKSLQLRAHLSEEELETLIELGKEEGTLLEVESEMITEILKLGDKNARDCMVPRVDCFLISDDLTNEEALAEIRENRFQRVPVYGESRDDILGILDAKKFLFSPEVPYVDLVDPPSFVPETMKALDLLKSFLARPQGIAIVVDEFGGMEGVVTLSDLVEEIISDAVPRGDRELYIERLDERHLLASGSARLDDLAEILGFEPEADGVGTIGGLVLTHLGQLPRPGTRVELPGMRITIRRITRKRIKDLLIEPLPQENAEETLS